ncbi:phage tail protein [Janthinobacterium sp. DSP2-3-3]|uniref:phage tail protein n=1 Tax=unclassified Janthinobacterium TaxID=2610881 RepID=UPI003CE9A909
MFSGNYAPPDWLMCNGQLLSISENEVLYTLIGTTYGGNGSTSFALPDLRGRVPIHMVANHPLGQAAGNESVTLQTLQLPAHTHAASAQKAAGTLASPTNGVWAAAATNNYATATSGLVRMNPTTISAVGSTLPHENMMPFLAVSFIIATAGIYPIRP